MESANVTPALGSSLGTGAMPRGLPTMPRAMLANESTDITLHLKLLLYSLINPYHANRGEDNTEMEVASEQSTDTLRRCFLDQTAYLCDIEKNGGTVPAAGLQEQKDLKDQSRCRVILWLAANEGVPAPVRKYIGYFRTAIREVTAENRETIEADMLDGAVAMASQRVQYYRDQMVIHAKACLAALKARHRSGGDADDKAAARKLRKWIYAMIKPQRPLDPLEHVNCCYAARRDIMPLARLFRRQDGCYSELIHYVGRLGAHVYAVKMILRAALEVPVIKTICEVQYESHPPPESIKIPARTAAAYDLVKKICEEEGIPQANIRIYLHAFADIDLDRNISEKFAAERTIPTFVHCEMQLVDLFSRAKWTFADGDRYIGCSKAACYFCRQYLALHPKGFVVPPTHDKIITGVRLPKPDPDADVNGNGAKTIREMERRMARNVNRDILASLASRNAPIPFKHCSSNGTSRATSVSAAVGRVPLQPG